MPMKPWQLLFGLHGAVGRVPFLVGVVGAVLAFALGIHGSERLLPWLAEVLAPRGINAGFALNAIWTALSALLVWALSALIAKRLRAVGRSPWWAPAAVVPLAILALLNDAIFLVSKSLVLPSALNGALLIGAAALTLWVVAQCLRADLSPTIPTIPRAF